MIAVAIKKELKINIGCGTSKVPGYVNIDLDPDVNPDLIADINKLPYDDDSVSCIRAYDILEHIDVEGLKEIHRVLSPEGTLVVSVPHYGCKNAYNDYTHKHFFNSLTLSNSIFKKLFTVVKQDVYYSFSNHLISFRLPLLFVRIHERCFIGFLPPSHIVATLKKNK